MKFSGTYSNGTSVNSMFDLMANGLKNSNNSDSKWSISQGFDGKSPLRFRSRAPWPFSGRDCSLSVGYCARSSSSEDSPVMKSRPAGRLSICLAQCK